MRSDTVAMIFDLLAIVDEKSSVGCCADEPIRPDKLVGLIKKDSVDLLFSDTRGRTILHHAVKDAQLEVIELCLTKGAEVNATDHSGETLLLSAVKSNEAEKILPLLIKHGANITARNDKNGQNIMHGLALGSVGTASMECAAQLIEAFIREGGSLEDREKILKYQPIHLATTFQKHDLVSRITCSNRIAQPFQRKFHFFFALSR